ncbi:MAG TPA: DNA-binding response regulator [Methylophaga sp.]|jgi:two-component system KDP operon response regulator KdpE|uniref:response regulator n=1 Tax=unclassified Methylophaga TaxID=2629249 RepID=UPI000C948B35|nr:MULTISPECIES: response regulator transcription factor [unclassified Methylophaga]MAP26968.1 DNA-binding response regulator [Methylophaga sp.]HAD30694.1 DNA-binding response regulator [Methylophaga sp.]HCN99344.1 DNA-binding response regulator [Methylophaga sp.]|tara:strand:+ start:11283 stop:11960 length:678 start_codon:yes stop_codon:yes gene_type:complete
MATILLIEDEAQIKKFLRISLEAHHHVVLEARLGEQGLAIMVEQKVDLLIVDLGLPDMDGQDVIKALRKWSQIPIIVLSVRSSEDEKVQALDAGANDYVTKPFGISELMARVRALLRISDNTVASSSKREINGLFIDLAEYQVKLDDRIIHLSRKEFELLRLLTEQPGHILTHRFLTQTIWGESFVDETHYLRVLVRQLRHKLGEEPIQPRFIETVQGVGYRFKV